MSLFLFESDTRHYNFAICVEAENYDAADEKARVQFLKWWRESWITDSEGITQGDPDLWGDDDDLQMNCYEVKPGQIYIDHAEVKA